ncbi:sporulation protein [Amycolatopsis rhizosphaerae]|uniref:Sporulation protein n=1 Tax=Amycolatopsis rhizosphaerae TaxID=2053003 RepID=A0A558CH55_9PSEU|nr:sporulation protein [Amycolatopsis rhizosphaerae]TVT48064.1 sporulation protein [Amycolatopsis rhizosphaerae]
MVFKKMLQAVGIGGPSVDTVLSTPECRPGEVLTGEVRLAGGDAEAEIEHLALSLVARGQGAGAPVEFHRAVVAGRFRLAAKENRVIPFELGIPWEAPVTDLFGQPLHGLSLGLRTELAVAKAVDKGDADAVRLLPTPGQEAVLDAFGRLGFHFKSAELEAGRLPGVRQTLPFFQEIEFYPPPSYAGRVGEVGLAFATSPDGLVVILEADRRSGRFLPGGEALGRIGVSHQEALETDWVAAISEWLDRLAHHAPAHGPAGQPTRFGSAPGYGPEHGHGYGHGYGHEYGERRGPGIGGVVAGAAAGAIGGMILGEMIEDAFDSGDEESF